MNHCAAYRRKFVACWQQNLAAAASNGTFNSWRGYCHTGHHCDHLELVFIMLRPDNAAAADPYAFATIAPASTGIVSDTSQQVRNGQVDAATSDQPDHWSWGRAQLNASSDTAYFLNISVNDEARVLAVAIFEAGTATGLVDDTETGAVDPTVGVGDWANVIDTTIGAVAASSPGFVWESQYHNTYGRTTTPHGSNDVPVVLAVYATKVVGINTGSVKIDDGAGNTLQIDNINALQWYTATGVLPAAAATKYDILAQCIAGTVRVDHVSFYEYE
jgi:hypothetical protein